MFHYFFKKERLLFESTILDKMFCSARLTYLVLCYIDIVSFVSLAMVFCC